MSESIYKIPVEQEHYFYTTFNPLEPQFLKEKLEKRLGGFRGYTLDLGAGQGDFLIHLSRTLPEWGHIALEKKWGRCRVICKKIFRQNLENTFVIQGRMEKLFGEGFPFQFEKIFMNYPDPWPKSRHHKRRTLRSENFIPALFHHLKPGGIFTFVSDHHPYVQQAKELFGKVEGWVNLHGELGFTEQLEGYHRTLFEKYARQDGLIPRYLQYQKRVDPPPL